MKILQLLLIFILIFSCTPDSFDVLENKVEKGDIKIIELRSDSKQMLADGKSIMEFRTVAYGIKEVKDLYKKQLNDLVSYHDSLRVDTFVIPEDQYPKGFINVYDESGKLIENNKFVTSDSEIAYVEFNAKAGELESNSINIKIRKAAVENYNEVVYPIIFHILMPPSSNVPAMKVTSEIMQEKLDLLNVIYNKKRTTNPNAGNVKITFKLAKYDKNGVLLKQEGLNIVNVAKDISPANLLKKMKEDLIWDANRYLNIWIGNISGNRWTSDGSLSYKVSKPNVILEGASIPGIEAKVIAKFEKTEDTELTDIGIVYNKADFLKPARMGGTSFDFCTIMGEYLGLYSMKFSEKWVNDGGEWSQKSNVIDGDTDFCEDTPVYDYTFSLFKKELEKDNYFTTFNIMADYSRKNSITVDQALRIREVLEKCPSRWSYKSNFAFTGQE